MCCRQFLSFFLSNLISYFLLFAAWWWCSLQAGWLQSRRNRQSAALSSPRGWSSRKAGQIADQRSYFANGICDWRGNLLRPHYRTYGWIRPCAAAEPKHWHRFGKSLRNSEGHACLRNSIRIGLPYVQRGNDLF